MIKSSLKKKWVIVKDEFIRIGRVFLTIADWTHGVSVVDIVNPAAPVGITQYQTPGRVRDVDIAGFYIYVADFDYGLRVLTWR